MLHRVSLRTYARRTSVLAVASLLLGAAACKKDPKLPAVGSADADKFLFDKGTAALEQKKWVEAREYFKKIIDTYPQSGYRADAKLGIGDSYIGEKRVDSLILGVNEFKEFMQYFPLNPKADYAQYRICAAESKQMLSPQRDQTATREALRDCDAFLQSNPQSKYHAEGEALRRQARDRLSESEYEIGVSYFRMRWYPGSTARLLQLIKDDPEFSKMDGVYFYLAESYYKSLKEAEALPYYSKLLEAYPKSEYVAKAKARMATIKIKH
ncbi:MAG TPA: outer membrane protein assembly factor BamD [Vicinamibacterales bacterium]|nr:outer membrane protein assembly factor BamD [Vicinamibacterales bacterium]